MKLLITGDWHLRASNPENRIDNFFQTQLNKVEQIFKIAQEENCEYILQPGDIFDTSRPSFDVLEEYIKLFNKYQINKKHKITYDSIEFITVFGQHDMRFRTKERTALKLMQSLGYVTIWDSPIFLDSLNGIELYSCNYGDEIPIPKSNDYLKILLIHKTILDKPQWKGQEDFLLSERLANKYSFDIIISGDWHHPVYYEYKDQTILNCGCLVRKTITEADLKPHVYIININDNLEYTFEKINLKFEPANKVFKEEALTKQISKENEKLNEFIESIKNNEIGNSLDFHKNLEILLNSTDLKIKDIILKELEILKND